MRLLSSHLKHETYAAAICDVLDHCLSTIDVTLLNYPGPPRFVTVIMGTPRDNDIAMEARGEAVLGGCILRGNEPRWVLVW